MIDIGGLFRCCMESVPTEESGAVAGGTEGQHIPCAYCKDGGVTFSKGRWIAAWRYKEDKQCSIQA